MDAGTIQRIETNVERAAAAFFAGAVAFAIYNAFHGALSPAAVSAAAGVAAVAGFLLCSRAMSQARAGATSFSVPIFNVRDLEPFESDELLLTGADRLPNELVLTDADLLQVEELLLDDPLPASTDSRVVRLFDRKAMPTPGALQSRVDDHLAQATPRHPPSDASQALAAALAELRQSLR
jgi:hypothetical protein